MGAEETYEEDIFGTEIVRRELLSLSVKVSRRLREKGLLGRTLTLKLRDPKFKTITRSKSIESPMDDYLPIYNLALDLLQNREGPFRLMGVTLSKLCDKNDAPPKARGLFEELENQNNHKSAGNPSLSRAMDLINAKFGKDSLRPATLLAKPKRVNLKDGEKDV
ncbi:MAG: hypothetical protein LBF22_05580 [Deltaproteobacteria bacterium]|nr:hypothetical protein [Deltaproteobacteria bacterium]